MSAVLQLWTGALTSDGCTVVAKLARDNARVRLVTSSAAGTTRSAEVASVGNIARIPISGLPASTAHTYSIEAGGRALGGVTGAFTTAPSGSGSYTIAFAGDASEQSNHVVFDTIRAASPLMFVHLGDLHYNNLTTNDVANYRAVYDEVFAQSRQAALYRLIPTAYVWDDHCYSDNNSDATAVSRAAAAAAYRERVPHYPLTDATGIWQTWDIGRVRYILTDQRSAASAKANTDNSAKSMLGATQKAWLKNLLATSPGKLIVWICPRMFGGVPTVGADHWGGFTNERTELANFIKANCHGRVVVISADMHALGIDDGSHHDYATGGGEPLRTFQAAPLDRTVDAAGYGGSQFSSGLFASLGQWGTMTVTDTGGPSIGILWRGLNSAGAQLASSSFSVSL